MENFMTFAQMLIVNINPWFGVMVGGIAVGIAIVWMNGRWAKAAAQVREMEHKEKMVAIETTHRETMQKISRDLPKLVDGRPAKVIDNGD